MKRKLAVILSADIAGYSRLVAEDEESAIRRLAACQKFFADSVARHEGRIFNTAGDAVLAEFQSAVNAVRCALDIQESRRVRNLAYPENQHMSFRMGITIGDVIERDGDLLGDGVNIAARLQGLSPTGGICVSRAVREAVAGKLSVEFVDMGGQKLKNIPEKVHAYKIDLGTEAAGAARYSAVNWLLRSYWMPLAAILVVVFAAGALLPRLSDYGSPTTGGPRTISAHDVPATPLASAEIRNIATPADGKSDTKPIVDSTKQSAPEEPKVHPTDTASSVPDASPAAPSTDREQKEASLQRLNSECAGAILSKTFETGTTACEALIKDGSVSGAERARALFNLGRIRRESGATDGAIEAFTEALRLVPTAASYMHRGIAEFDKGNWDKAVTDFSEAIRLEPANGEAYNNRAWVQLKAGRLKDALRDADLAVQALATEAYTWDTRGQVNEALGNRSDAVRDYRKAMELDPENETSREGLKRLGASRQQP